MHCSEVDETATGSANFWSGTAGAPSARRGGAPSDLSNRRNLRIPGRPDASARRPGHSQRVSSGVDLYWLPLGAGGHSVRFNGLVYEALIATIERRERCDLYHSALEVRVPDGRYVIEMTPAVGGGSGEHGVVAGGAVGSRMLGWTNLFRYEVRCWRDGEIPDTAEAVESPRVLGSDQALAQRVLDLARLTPTPTWGRDELRTGDMWNSNSLVSWLLVSAGVQIDQVPLPAGGRAPGWDAGVAVARRAAQQAPAAIG